jgi:hypothetical protein
MADYQLTSEPGVVIRTSDGARIPNDPLNADHQVFVLWGNAGGVPDPAPVVPPPPPPPPPVKDANARIDAGVLAALDVAVAVRDAMQNIPDAFTAARVTAVKIQLDALTEALVAMLQAQKSPPS